MSNMLLINNGNHYVAHKLSVPKPAGQGELEKLVNKKPWEKEYQMKKSLKQYRLAVIRKEFSFVDRLMDDVAPENVDSIKIEKGDRNLLAKVGYEDSYSYCDGGHYDYTKYFAVVGEEVIELASAGRSATGSGDHNEWNADTIAEQLFSRNIDPDYIVECVKNDTDDNGQGEVSRFWTIFKMKRFDLVTYHQQKIDEVAAIIKSEIAAACA